MNSNYKFHIINQAKTNYTLFGTVSGNHSYFGLNTNKSQTQVYPMQYNVNGKTISYDFQQGIQKK